MSTKTYLNRKRDLLPTTYYHNGKRDLLPIPQWEKRPTAMAKETYRNGKRDLPQWQKRPTAMAKETYYLPPQ